LTVRNAEASGLVAGARRWFLSPPSEGISMRQSVASLWLNRRLQGEVSPASSKLAKVMSVMDSVVAPPLQCTQRAGDILFVGQLWGRGYTNLHSSIGISAEVSLTSPQFREGFERALGSLIDAGLTREDAIEKLKASFIANIIKTA